MYIIKHFCTDSDDLFRVIYETSSIAEQLFHGTYAECEYYIHVMETEPVYITSPVRKYAHDMKTLKVWLS